MKLLKKDIKNIIGCIDYTIRDQQCDIVEMEKIKIKLEKLSNK